jgi:hypothetical protein
MRILLILFAATLCAASPNPPKKTTYSLSKEPIDVVIPCIHKDLYSLEHCIAGIKKNGKNIRRVIVVSPERLSDSAEWFDENLFPFSKKDLAVEIFHGDEIRAIEFLQTPRSRIGWVFQQFLKFIPATEYERAYFDHAARLLPWLKRVYPTHSGVSHHMLFQRPILEDLFSLIKLQHGVEPWRAICRCIDQADLPWSCMSEYEIYFNFVFLRTEQAALNHTQWTMVPNLHNISSYQRQGQAFIVCPEWYRTRNGF